MKDATVYRLFDSDDNALYVGCTGGFQRRSYGHRDKPWWTEVVRAEFSHHADRTEALAHEAAEILRLRPKHNTAHNVTRGPLIALAACRGMTIKAFAAKAGVTRQTLYNIERGHIPNGPTVYKLADALEITPAELLDVLYPRTAEVAA